MAPVRHRRGTNLIVGLAVEGSAAPVRVMGMILLVGAVCYGLSLVLYISGAQQLGAARSQILFSTAPFCGVALAWMLLGESILPVQLLAGALMIVGLWLLRGERHQHRHAHHPLRHVHYRHGH